MKLIELHRGDRLIALNLDKIGFIQQSEWGGTRILVDGLTVPGYVDEDYDAVMEKIREATAEAEPEDFLVPGFLTAFTHHCPECNYLYKDLRWKGHNYCPNCGAKMDGERRAT